MSRLFYRIIVSVFYAFIGLALLALEVLLIGWLVDKYPNKLAWAGYVMLGLIDIPIMMALWNRAIKCVRAA